MTSTAYDNILDFVELQSNMHVISFNTQHRIFNQAHSLVLFAYTD